MFEGNDLARVLRWGSGYTGAEDPLNLLRDVIDAEEIRLDRWTVVFHPEDKTDDNAKQVNSTGKKRQKLSKMKLTNEQFKKTGQSFVCVDVVFAVILEHCKFDRLQLNAKHECNHVPMTWEKFQSYSKSFIIPFFMLELLLLLLLLFDIFSLWNTLYFVVVVRRNTFQKYTVFENANVHFSVMLNITNKTDCHYTLY